MRSSIVILVAAAALLAGCGTTSSAGNFSGERASVARTLDDYSSAAQGHNTSKICTQLFSAALVKRLGDCQGIIGSQLNSADSFDLKVESVTVSGPNAQARVKSTANGKDRFDTLMLAHGPDGRWRIAGLG